MAGRGDLRLSNRAHGEVPLGSVDMQSALLDSSAVCSTGDEADRTAEASRSGSLYEHRSVVAPDTAEAGYGDILE